LSTLLDRTRRLMRALAAQSADLDALLRALADVLTAESMLVDSEGRILGRQGHGNGHVEGGAAVADLIPGAPGDLEEAGRWSANGRSRAVLPVHNRQRRVGALVLGRRGPGFSDDDLILAEFGAYLAGEILTRQADGRREEAARERAAVRMAVDALSFSELQAVKSVVNELRGAEGLIVASRIADQVGITRSVIVNALRKFESAGILEVRSLGMKGTYIRVLNRQLREELGPRPERAAHG